MSQRSIQLTWPVDYAIREVPKPKRLGLLLHGFQQDGNLILRSLSSCFDEETVLIAPNGLYPAPRQTEDGLDPAYTWYFFDVKNNRYLTTMEQAVDYVTSLITALGYMELPTVVIGYSQGGYLAPHAALALNETEQVIGINCRFRDEALPAPLPFPIHGIHGLRDKLVDPDRAARCHDAIISAGSTGTFTGIADAGHGISGGHRDAIKNLIAS